MSIGISNNYEHKLWSNLFTSLSLIPMNDMTFNEQLNCLTRLFILLVALMLLFDFKYAIPFLVISILFIIILYYIEKSRVDNMKNTCNENYSPPKMRQMDVNTGERILFCDDYSPVGVNSIGYISKNQMLYQGANKITKIPPVIVPPSHDLSYWRANQNVVDSRTNNISNIDMYHSGYAVSQCCNNPVEIKRRNNETKESYIQAPTPMEPKTILPYIGEEIEPYIQAPTPMEPKTILPYIGRENYTDNGMRVRPNEPGWVNTMCGYNTEQTRVNLPANMPVGNCQQKPEFKEYNKNLFMQTIQPNVYSINDVIEPINSNIGISFQQQFEPTTVDVKPDGDVYWKEHDPRLFQFKPKQIDLNNIPPNESNVYDPRFSGYGTSYRSYNDNVTGNTRYVYDDVNAIRMPNYVVRSKIDFLPYADSYGPIAQGNENGNKDNSNIREMVNDSWVNNSLQFRNDMMESYMRKRNGEMWQIRQAPKYT